MRSRLWVVSLCYLSLSCPIFATSKKLLSIPPNGQCLDAVDSRIQSVHRYKDLILMGVARQGFFIKTPFNGIKAEQEASFGKHKDSERVAITKDLARGNWQGIEVFNDKVLMLDGENDTVALYTLDKLQLIHARTIAWDGIRPARDAQGEPTKHETQKMRNMFREAYFKAGPEKFTGLARDTSAWLGKDAHYFFVATKISGFPLVTLKCSKEDNSSCHFDRACFIDGRKLNAADVSGVAVNPGKREVILADQKEHALHTFDFRSCYNVRFKRTTRIDKMVKNISSIAIDHDGALWLSSTLNDDRNNASVFVWTNW